MNGRFISGFLNCHLPELHSYVIRERVSDCSGMIRIFHNTGSSMSSLVKEDGDYRVAPHNHQQDIRLFMLSGSVVNVNFEVHNYAPGRRSTFEYWFGSALKSGEFSIHFHDMAEMFIDDISTIPESGIVLNSKQVHTVVAAPGSAWLVAEGQIAPAKQRSVCYSKKPNLKLNSAGLYIPMSPLDLGNAGREFSWKQIDEIIERL